MAIITDLTDLVQSTQPGSGTPDGNVYIDTAAKTIEIITGQNGMTIDGVTLQALYSFIKEEWKTDTNLIKFPFPMVAITPEQFEFVEGWKPNADATRKLIRTGGWREIDSSTVLNREYFCVITLGNIDNVSRSDGDTVYYFFEGDTSATDFTYAGPVNEAVQTYGDADNGAFDNRTKVFTARIRIYGNTYDQSSTPDIGISAGSTITYKVERFPLSEGEDPIITYVYEEREDVDAAALLTVIEADATEPFSKMSIGYFDIGQTRTGFNSIAGDVPSAGSAQFGVIIDADTDVAQSADGDAAAEYIYAWVQAQLVQTTDINTGLGASTTAVKGNLAEPLLSLASAGNTLSSLGQTANPVDIALTDLVIGTPSGNACTWTSAGASFPTLTAGDYLTLSGATNAANNSVWVVTTVTTPNTLYTMTLTTTGPPVAETSATDGSVKISAGTGVYVDSFDLDDKNRVQFTDNDGSTRTFPYVATGSINFNQYLVDDTNGYYWMFYEYTHSKTITDLVISGEVTDTANLVSASNLLTGLSVGNYIQLTGTTAGANDGIWKITIENTPNQSYTAERYHGETAVAMTTASVTLKYNPINSPAAILVDNNSSADISGDISAASVSFDYDYDGNVQGGRSAAVNAPVILRAIGYETAQFIEATGTINRSTGQTFTMVAGLERNYYDEAE